MSGVGTGRRTTARARRPTVLGDFAADRRMLLVTALALPIGALAGVAAWALLRLIGLVTNLVFFGRVDTDLVSPAAAHAPWWVIVFAPIVGGLIIGVMARYGSEKIRGHGMPEAIESILTGGSKVSPRVTVLKPISAAVSIGSGGPFGAEGPIIMTGGAVGSLLAMLLRLTADERKALLVAGAAGGMAATFNSPLAAVLLAVELLLFELRPRSFVPVVASVAVATLVRWALLGRGPVFGVDASSIHLSPAIFGLVAAVGLTGGLLAVGATWLVYRAEDAFHRIPLHWMWWPAIGGVFVGIGGLFVPHALGVGYDVIDRLLTGHATMALILGILVVKTTIWSISLGSGTSGGILAPMFMVGGALGALEGMVLPDVMPGFWAMCGLAAVLGGVMRSPLTGVAFTLELTHAWGALLPLLLSATAAYALSVLVLKRSVLTEKIARRGLHLTREYSVDPLELFFARDVMRTLAPDGAGGADKPATVSVPVATGSLGAVEEAPAADGSKELTVYAGATLREVAYLFAEHETTSARVLDPDDDRPVGSIELEDLLHARLHDLKEEHHRARVLLARPGPSAGRGPRGRRRPGGVHNGGERPGVR